MPPEVNVEERLREIAEATLDLASESGPGGVTVRAVAARLGGSTTRVTKYLPTRADLLANAFEYMSAHWEQDLSSALDDTSGMDRVKAIARWSLQTVGHDDGVRRLWLETLTGSPVESSQDQPVDEAHEEYDSIREIVDQAAQPPWLADLMFLAFRGFYLSSVEDPEAWPSDRAYEAVNGMLNNLESAEED